MPDEPPELCISRIRRRSRTNPSPHSRTVYQSERDRPQAQEEAMNTRNKIRSLMGGAAMVATAVGMTAGLDGVGGAVPVASQLTIVDQNITGAGFNRVIVQGCIRCRSPMPLVI